MTRAQFTTPFPAGLRPAFATLLLALALSGCIRRVVVEVPGPPAPCLVEPPPVAATWEVLACDGMACLTDDDARAVADEVDARRLWDARAWQRCRERPAEQQATP